MAIEIRIESTWDTDDGEGRRIEVTVAERGRPSDDPLEGTRYFASGDLEALKRFLAEIIDRKAARFMGPRRRECSRCGAVVDTGDHHSPFVCAACLALQ
jgi:ribosomal protein S27AE